MIDIWNICDSTKEIVSISRKVWRVVEDQARSSTRSLVDSLEEHDILENELEKSKPKLNNNLRQLDYLLFTPFRYAPLNYGSRFGIKIEHSLWYGSSELKTALTERAYYRFVFLMGSEMSNVTDRILKTAFSVKIKTERGINLIKPPFLQYKKFVSSATSWTVSQELGQNMRKNNIEVFTYYSARDFDAVNVGVFSPEVFYTKKPCQYKSLVEFSNQQLVEFIDKESHDKYAFKIDDFMINGQFPLPSEVTHNMPL